MKQENGVDVSPKPQDSEKKEYSTPVLTGYGDIRSITQGGTASTLSDSGSNHMSPP
jgi:hypothetical protein